MPRHLLLLLTLVLSMLLLAFGWRLLRRDFELEQQQQIDHLREEATDLVVAALQQAISATEAKLRDQEAMRFLATTPDAISVTFAEGQLEALPHGRLLYYAVASAGESAPDAAFEHGEALEYQRQAPKRAAEWFLQLARKASALVRAGALIRAARNLTKSGQHEAALVAYSDAARLATTAIGEVPTELFARWATCDVLDKLGRAADLKKEALELRELLLEGRWRITRPVFDVHLQAASRWAKAGEPPATHRLALSDAVGSFWSSASGLKPWPTPDAGLKPWPTTAAGLKPWPTAGAAGVVQPFRAAGIRSTITAGGVEFTVLSQTAGHRTNAFIAGPAFVEFEWKPRIAPIERRHGVRVTLHDTMQRSGASGTSRRVAGETGLPWTITVQSSVVKYQ